MDTETAVNTDIYVDSQTGLMWTRNGNIAGRKMDWNDAMNWVKNLDYGGYKDWRLPTIEEFESFTKQGKKHPYDWFNANGFKNVLCDMYWSGSSNYGHDDNAWSVILEDGMVCNNTKSYYGSVWPVRSGQPNQNKYFPSDQNDNQPDQILWDNQNSVKGGTIASIYSLTTPHAERNPFGSSVKKFIIESLSGLFAKKLKPPTKDDWPNIVNDISDGFEGVRAIWFDRCKILISSLYGTKIKNDKLISYALIYAKTFQLYNAFAYIGYKEYVAPSDGKEFRELLLDKVCDNDKGLITLTKDYFIKLSKNSVQSNKRFIMFASDISTWITNNKSPDLELMEVIPTLQGFVDATYMVVANSFGDRRTSAKIGSKVLEK